MMIYSVILLGLISGGIAWYLLRDWRWSLLFFFFNIVAPYVGFVASILLGAYFAWQLYRKKEFYHTKRIDRSFYYHSFPKIVRKFGESSVKEFLENEQIPLQKRLMALNLIAERIDRSNIGYIKRLLQSNEDELRLYAFSILDRIEKDIFSKIRFYKGKEDPAAKSALMRLYFELIDLGLVEEGIKEYYEKEIEKLAKELLHTKEYYDDAKKMLIDLSKRRGDFFSLHLTKVTHKKKCKVVA